MNTLSTHVLDVSLGRPAAAVELRLERQQGGDEWETLSVSETNDDGRAPTLLPRGTELAPGVYRLTFETGAYFRARKTEAFYPYVQVTFELGQNDEHYHVPLLLSPFGFSTYRGS